MSRRSRTAFEEFAIANDAVLIGNGFGGTVALAFAIAHPERIAKLVLSDAAACFPPEGRKAFAAMAAKVAESGLGAVAEIAAKRVFSPAYLAAHPEEIEERKQVLLGDRPEGFPGRLQDFAGDRSDAAAASPARADAGRVRRARPGDAAGAQQSDCARRWRARAMSNCPAAAIARRSNSRRRFWPRSRNLSGFSF